jgi:predicted NBD/HSP70 family sugar kinase
MSRSHPIIRGSNLPVLREFNHNAVFENIRRSSGISRIEISRRTGLAAQTVSNITRDLLREKLVVESGVVAGERGKPPRLLRLNPQGRYAFGVHLEPAHIGLLLLDLAGDVVVRYPFQSGLNAKDSIKAIADKILEIQLERKIPLDRIGGIGVASPGPLDMVSEKILNPPNLIGWDDFPIAAELRNRTGLPVIVEKDVTAACQGETWYTDATNRNFLFIYMGLGMAFGFVRKDEVYRGNSGNEGNLVHLVIDPNGPECWCGQHGCVSVSAEPRSIVTEASRLGLFPGPTHVDGPREINDTNDLSELEDSFDFLCLQAKQEIPTYRSFLSEIGRRIGRLVSILSDALDLDEVVLGGPYWSKIDALCLHDVRQEAQKRSIMRHNRTITVRSTKLSADVAEIGAASNILNNDLSPRADSLVIA